MFRLEQKRADWQLPVLVAAWAVAIYFVLQVHQLPGDWGHDICGPWGCGPPLQALLSYHGFWLVLLSLPTFFVCQRLEPNALRTFGLILLWTGNLSILGIGVWEWLFWSPVAEVKQNYFLQRWMFSIGTLIDVPIVPVGFAGLACLFSFRIRKPRPSEELQLQTKLAEDAVL